MRIDFSTKAGTLSSLLDVLVSARIAPMAVVSVSDWSNAKKNITEKVVQELGVGPYIVRSSSIVEDREQKSNAGAFLSMLEVNPDGLNEAIESVIASYVSPNAKDEVLIQPMVSTIG